MIIYILKPRNSRHKLAETETFHQENQETPGLFLKNFGEEFTTRQFDSTAVHCQLFHTWVEKVLLVC